MQLVIELDGVLGQRGFKNWEELEGFLENTVDLGSKHVCRRVVPELQNPPVCVDDVVVARNDVLRSSIVVFDRSKDCQHQGVKALVKSTVVWGISQGGDVKGIGA